VDRSFPASTSHGRHAFGPTSRFTRTLLAILATDGCLIVSMLLFASFVHITPHLMHGVRTRRGSGFEFLAAWMMLRLFTTWERTFAVLNTHCCNLLGATTYMRPGDRRLVLKFRLRATSDIIQELVVDHGRV